MPLGSIDLDIRTASETEDEARQCKAFMADRDWASVKRFWESCLVSALSVPEFVSGDDIFGLTCFDDIHYTGVTLVDTCSRRKTFALRVGYLGWNYNGFQLQRGVGGVYTVQDDLAQILSRTSVAAGRTDKDVSALSQVLSFHTYDEITEGDIKELFAQSEAQMQGRIKLFSCTRVPRRFHALFLATWRRYVYAFPLKPGAYSGYDVDVAYVARQLSSLVDKDLSFKAFEVKGKTKALEGGCYICRMRRIQVATVHNADGSCFLLFELVGNRFLRHLVRAIVGTALLDSLQEDRRMDEQWLLQRCSSLPGEGSARRVVIAPGLGLALCGVGYCSKEILS